MNNPDNSRREFVKSSLGIAWLSVNSSLLLAACREAQNGLDSQAAYMNITADQAVELGAVVDQIIPEDETPGASETGVVYFIDAALGGFMASAMPVVKQGLEELRQKSASADGSSRRFSDLPFNKQTEVLRLLEDTPFFGDLQFLTVCGMFSLSLYGGNRDHAGWGLIGFDHQHAWQPPFGFYDAALAGNGDEHGKG